MLSDENKYYTLVLINDIIKNKIPEVHVDVAIELEKMKADLRIQYATKPGLEELLNILDLGTIKGAELGVLFLAQRLLNELNKELK